MKKVIINNIFNDSGVCVLDVHKTDSADVLSHLIKLGMDSVLQVNSLILAVNLNEVAHDLYLKHQDFKPFILPWPSTGTTVYADRHTKIVKLDVAVGSVVSVDSDYQVSVTFNSEDGCFRLITRLLQDDILSEYGEVEKLMDHLATVSKYIDTDSREIEKAIACIGKTIHPVNGFTEDTLRALLTAKLKDIKDNFTETGDFSVTWLMRHDAFMSNVFPTITKIERSKRS